MSTGNDHKGNGKPEGQRQPYDPIESLKILVKRVIGLGSGSNDGWIEGNIAYVCASSNEDNGLLALYGFRMIEPRITEKGLYFPIEWGKQLPDETTGKITHYPQLSEQPGLNSALKTCHYRLGQVNAVRNFQQAPEKT